ncbi:MAG: VOC family protein [Patescibacteria group bacterium]|jgi:catechol 2,3-dioxygenase-like lactoylglutathione lyase family enzyme
MLNHITVRVSDMQKSKIFYSQILRPLGYKLLAENKKTVGFGIEPTEGRHDFWLIPGEGGQQPHSFSCLAFTAGNKQMVDEFYRAGIEAGGKDNGPPGYRKQYHPGYYAAFVLDPDGHNIEAVFDDWSMTQS